MPERKQQLLRAAIKSGSHLKMVELKAILDYCFADSDKKQKLQVGSAIRHLDEQHCFSGEERHPVILIVDEVLFPWMLLK